MLLFPKKTRCVKKRIKKKEKRTEYDLGWREVWAAKAKRKEKLWYSRPVWLAANEATAGLALVINMNHGAGPLCLRGPPWKKKKENDLLEERPRTRKRRVWESFVGEIKVLYQGFKWETERAEGDIFIFISIMKSNLNPLVLQWVMVFKSDALIAKCAF